MASKDVSIFVLVAFAQYTAKIHGCKGFISGGDLVIISKMLSNQYACVEKGSKLNYHIEHWDLYFKSTLQNAR